MKREEFNQLLLEANLTKRNFCEVIGLNYDTVNGWGSSDKNIPIWVISWLENYKKTKLYEEIKTKIFEIEGVTS